MSFSQPTKSSNPAKKFISFSKGKWKWYDKENETDVDVQLPLYFVILDDLFTIKGWSDAHESYIYSNEVHNTNEKLTIKSFKPGVNIVGYYSDIKANIKEVGGKYCKSIYALVFDKEFNTELVNISISGAALGPWIESKIKPNSQSVALLPDIKKDQKGSVEFFVPSYGAYKIPDEMIEKATEADKELQEYLQQYKSGKEAKEVETEVAYDEASQELELERADLEKQADDYVASVLGKKEDDLPF